MSQAAPLLESGTDLLGLMQEARTAADALLGDATFKVRERVTVNGRRVRAARLRDGDELQLGKFSFKMRIGFSPAIVPLTPAPEHRSRPTAARSRPRRAAGGMEGDLWRLHPNSPRPLAKGVSTAGLGQRLPRRNEVWSILAAHHSAQNAT